ncbi:hypothetical protein SK128_027656, partial [Halocaridina rubra]
SEAARKFVHDAKEQIRSFRRNDISNKLPLPDDPPPPYYPSLDHLDDLSNGKQNGFLANSHHQPSVNNSYNQPSAPRASMSSMSSHNVPNNVGVNGAHAIDHCNGPRSQPTAPCISPSSIHSPLPNSPPPVHYPVLPNISSDYPSPVSPATPTSPISPASSGHPHAHHFQSVPNLGDGLSHDYGLRYPPLNVYDNSSYNDSSFHPDTSSSSPNLLSRRMSNTSVSATSPPFNPYYDWLPGHAATKHANDKNNSDAPQRNSEGGISCFPKPKKGNTSKPNSKGESPKVLNSKGKSAAPPTPDKLRENPSSKLPNKSKEDSTDKHPASPSDSMCSNDKQRKIPSKSAAQSVRPKTGRNPFFEDSTDEEDTQGNKSTGREKKNTLG